MSCHNFCVPNTTEWSAGPPSLTAPFAGSDFLYEGAKFTLGADEARRSVSREITAGVSVFLIVSSAKLERSRSHPGVLTRWTVNGSSRFCVTV